MPTWFRSSCFGLVAALCLCACGGSGSGNEATGGSGGRGGAGGSAGTGGAAGAGGMGGSEIARCNAPRDCDDDEPCTKDLCVDGICGYEPLADDTVCGSETGLSACLDGACQSVWPSCTDPSAEEGDFCQPTPSTDRIGRCVSGECVIAACQIPFDCWDGDQCTSDVCDDSTGECSHPNAPDGTRCGVVTPMQCVEGECVSLPPT